MASKIVQLTPKVNKVEKDKVVTLKYALFESENDEVLEYREDLNYLHGGYEDLLVNLQDALTGHEIGEKIEVSLSAKEAFGPHLEELVMSGAADQFPDEAQQLWTHIQGQANDGSTREFVVTHVENGMITVDGNHPYAGKNLRFIIEIINIRRATKEEIKKGLTIQVQ